MPNSGLLERAGTVAQVMVEDIENPILRPDDINHLAKSLRVRAGEPISVIDGKGSWRICLWRGTTDELELTDDVKRSAPIKPLITVGFSLLKGDKAELVVQKLTELGVDRIVPFKSARSIVRWDERKSDQHLERFRRIAYEASMQARRLTLPAIDEILPMSKLDWQGDFAEASIANPGGESLTLDRHCVFVGPEGGWDPIELVNSQSVVGLGPTVLRAETAAITVGAVLCALRANLTNFA